MSFLSRRDLLKSAVPVLTVPQLLFRAAYADAARPDQPDDAETLYRHTQRSNTLRIIDLPQAIQTSYDTVVNKIYSELDTPPLRYRRAEGVKSVVQKLQTLSSSAAEWASADDALTRQLLAAEVVSGWVRHNIRYFLRPQEERKKGNDPDNILRESIPMCDCSGFTAVAVRLSNGLGLTCHHAGGTTRAYGDRVTEKDCHGWVIYDIEGKLIPSDVTNPPAGDEERYYELACFDRLWGKVGSHNVLPLRPVEWETFLARHYTHYYGNYEWLDVEPLMNIQWETWRDMPSTVAGHLQSVLATARRKHNRKMQLG